MIWGNREQKHADGDQLVPIRVKHAKCRVVSYWHTYSATVPDHNTAWHLVAPRGKGFT